MGSLEIVIELLAFGLVFLVSLAVARQIIAGIDIRRRLGEGAEALSTGSVVKGETVKNPALRWVQSATLDDVKSRQKLRRDLSLAGFEQPTAPVLFVIFRFGLAVGLPILFLVLQGISPRPILGLPLIFVTLALCAVGLACPSMLLSNRIKSRNAQLEQEFPDALDLLVVCVEAGLALEGSFIRVADEVQESHPRVAEAFDRVSDELRAGRSRADALRSMGERTTVDAVKSFVALLIQTDALGSSIAQALRIYSAEMREHRFLRAEEKAMRIPVLLTIPLVACILPVIVTALLLPAGIDVARQLIPMLTHRQPS